tara:strand:- start:652 stop:843 length:192 start_codon:yes stop_codon:yes gene_type:complete
MTDQERQIEHLKDQLFKLRIKVQGISGSAAAMAEWAETPLNKSGFKKIERKLDEAVEEIKMRP